MCESKFTKGEWKIFNERVGVVDDSDTQSYGMMIEVTCVDMYNFGDAEGKANTHLIAAAPEMYAMLENISVSMECFHGIDTDSINNLLAKARGEHV